jgi:glycosyltransferase involved in cell wall biosynthesis
MAALSELFDRTTLVLPRRVGPPPAGLRSLAGRRLSVAAVPEPRGRGVLRKLSFLAWLPLRLPALWRAAGEADAVHAAVPGDVGTLGIVLALARRKRLFVRHCGTWGQTATVADRALRRLLLGIAERHVVFATGGGSDAPSGRPEIGWIFSTTLAEAELAALPRAEPWRPGRPPRLIAVGRLTRGKNVASAIRALAEIRAEYPGATLDVLGHGPELDALVALAERLGLAGAVTFHGNLSHEDVLARLAASHLLVFPTRVAEGFPKAVLEAMACGVPALASAVSVIPDLLAEGRGFLLDDATPEAVAAGLRRAFSDPDRLARAAEASRRHAARFTLERWRDAIGERLEEAWQCSLRGSDA